MQAVRPVKIHQRPRQIGRRAQIAEPGAALLGELLDVRPSVAGIDERHKKLPAFAVIPGAGLTGSLPGRLVAGVHVETARIALGLRNLAGDIDVFALGFDHGHRRESGKQHVIGGLLAGGGPFGDGFVPAFFGAGATRMGDDLRIGLPAGFSQLLVDQDAGQFFVR